MKYLIIPLIVITVFGCSDRLLDRTSTLDDPEPVEVNQEKLECSIAASNEGSVLTVELPGDHGGDFAIQDPQGVTFFLTSSDPPRNAIDRELIDRKVFGELNEYRVLVDAIRAVPYVYGADSLQNVFDYEGVYTLRVSENLETSADFKHFICQVEYSRSPSR